MPAIVYDCISCYCWFAVLFAFHSIVRPFIYQKQTKTLSLPGHYLTCLHFNPVYLFTRFWVKKKKPRIPSFWKLLHDYNVFIRSVYAINFAFSDSKKGADTKNNKSRKLSTPGRKENTKQVTVYYSYVSLAECGIKVKYTKCLHDYTIP